MNLDELLEQSDEEILGALTELPEEELERLAGDVHRGLVWPTQAREFSVQGFTAFFNLFHGELHREGKLWVANVFEAIESGKRGLLEECFRGSGKTVVFSKHFFAFYVGHHPERTSGIIRINDIKASETAGGVAQLIDKDPRWEMVFPDVVPDKERGWGEDKGYYLKRGDVDYGKWLQYESDRERPQGPTFIGYGYKSGSVIGSRWNGLAVVDDILDRENTRSDRQQQEVKAWVTDVYLPITVPGQTLEIWNFTPWLLNDVYAERIATGQYVHSKSPVMRPAKEGEAGASYFPPHPQVALSGKWWVLSWPERWGFAEITDIYISIGSVSFARMYMLDLEATKGLTLKTEWLHEYPLAQVGASWPVFMGVDYASTADKLKDKESDFFALAICRAIPGGGLVLVDGFRGRISKGEALEKVVAYAGLYPTYQLVGVESIGTGKEFYNDLVLTNDAFGNPLKLLPITHGRKSKGERFENWLGPRFQMSRIWISDTPTPFLNAFRDEWMLWPNAPHDDTLDAVYMAASVGEGHLPVRGERSAFGKKKKQRHPYGAFMRT